MASDGYASLPFCVTRRGDCFSAWLSGCARCERQGRSDSRSCFVRWFTWSILSLCWLSPCSAVSCCLSACNSRPNWSIRTRSCWSSSLLVDFFCTSEEMVVSISILWAPSVQPSHSMPSGVSVDFVEHPLLLEAPSASWLLLLLSVRVCPLEIWLVVGEREGCVTVPWLLKPLVALLPCGVSSISIRLTTALELVFDSGEFAVVG